ncbi:MAG: cyclic nucleotide-binding domain-containing protein [Alphaproteobacteria bacterium]|nr:cyclic nucleotide-binding domain-containing protein [Alphaproteobacteria bacterium]
MGDEQKYLKSIMFGRGAVIFREGDHADRAYLIDFGKVELSRMRDHDKQVVAIVADHHLFGEMALIDGGGRSTDAVALLDTRCYVIDAEQFRIRLRATDGFIRTVMRVLCSHIRHMNDKL